MTAGSIFEQLTERSDRSLRFAQIRGVVIGLVTNNKDPEKLGRVKVRFPWLGPDVETWWARVVQPMTGRARGQYWIPEIDDEVLVGFDHGDVRFPYVLRALYNGVDRPPKCDDVTSGFGGVGYDHGPYPCAAGDHNADGQDDLRFIRSRAGHLLVMDDAPGAEKVTLCDQTGAHRLEIFSEGKRLVVTSADGDVELIAGQKILLRCETLVTESRADTSMSAGGTFDVTSQDDMRHQASDGHMRRGAAKAVEERTREDAITLEAAQTVRHEASSGMSYAATAAQELVAAGEGELIASSVLTIQGSLVDIDTAGGGGGGECNNPACEGAFSRAADSGTALVSSAGC